MVFVQCNIIGRVFKQGGQYGAVQHNHNGDKVIVRCNIIPMLALWLCGYAGARGAGYVVRESKHTPHHSTPAYFTMWESNRKRFKGVLRRFVLS